MKRRTVLNDLARLLNEGYSDTSYWKRVHLEEARDVLAHLGVDRRLTTADVRSSLAGPVAVAAASHRPTTEQLLNFDCWSGNCDDPTHEEAGECPSLPVIVCAACFALAQALNDEYVPDEVLASSCPVCLAVMKVAAATGGPLL